MSVERVRNYLRTWNLEERVKEFEVSSATVALAAQAVGCEEARIAKTMSFLVNGAPILILLAGDVKIDNRKYKDQFHTKAQMIKPEHLVELIGHPMGGVCPFDIHKGVTVYLDESLRRFDKVYPAAGSAASAVELNLAELELSSGAVGWVDVSKLNS